MGTNSTACAEWERDFDPATEQPYVTNSAGRLAEAAADSEGQGGGRWEPGTSSLTSNMRGTDQ